MPKRALILGGGGPVGIAWESGLLAGFAEGGVNLENADFIAGTSAGSFVGAQIALGKTAAALATPIIAEEAPTQRAGSSSAQPSGPAPDLTTLIAKMGEAVSGKSPAKEVRRNRQMGARSKDHQRGSISRGLWTIIQRTVRRPLAGSRLRVHSGRCALRRICGVEAGLRCRRQARRRLQLQRSWSFPADYDQRPALRRRRDAISDQRRSRQGL